MRPATSPYAMELQPDTGSVFTGSDSESTPLSLDDFRPIGKTGPLRPPAPIRPSAPMPYARQHPETATRVRIRTPGGEYESGVFTIDPVKGRIRVDADGLPVLLDRRNVVVYLDPGRPTIYPAAQCRVVFS